MATRDTPPADAPRRDLEMPTEDFIRRAAGNDVPVELMWALGFHESSFRPWLVNPTSHATGAWQITSPVVRDYNEANGTAYALEDMKHPELAALVAASLLRRVIANWNASSPALKADFGSERYVSLLVLGWNSGPNAVLRLTKNLEAAGVARETITVDLLHKVAVEHGLTTWITKAERVAWAKQVAATFGDLRNGRKEIVATLVPRPQGVSFQRLSLHTGVARGVAPAKPVNASVTATAASPAATDPAAPTPPVDTSAPTAPVSAPAEATAARSAPAMVSGPGVGAGLTIALLGLGGAAAMHGAAASENIPDSDAEGEPA